MAPAILQAFQIPIAVIEGPCIGCYDASSGGWFRRHRDNTSGATAHRQFALSLNLNETDAYDGGEVRFPEFGRELTGRRRAGRWSSPRRCCTRSCR